MKIASLAFLFYALAYPAEACHRFSVWHYPYAQRCSVRVAQREAPLPPVKAPEIEAPEAEIPLPSLKDMEFPPDCDADWCQRLKGIGLLREKFGTN